MSRARVSPLSGAPAAPVRAITRAASINPWRRLAKAAARSRAATASHRDAPVRCTWCAVAIAGAQRFSRLVQVHGGGEGNQSRERMWWPSMEASSTASKARTYQTTTPGRVGCPRYATDFLAQVQPICTPGVWLLGPSTMPAGTQRARARLGQVLHITLCSML